jgi:hypothetical protein
MAREGSSLVFIGDGMSKQNQDALVCEILRTDTNVELHGKMNDEYHQLFHNFTISWTMEEGSRLSLVGIIYC